MPCSAGAGFLFWAGFFVLPTIRPARDFAICFRSSSSAPWATLAKPSKTACLAPWNPGSLSKPRPTHLLSTVMALHLAVYSSCDSRFARIVHSDARASVWLPSASSAASREQERKIPSRAASAWVRMPSSLPLTSLA